MDAPQIYGMQVRVFCPRCREEAPLMINRYDWEHPQDAFLRTAQMHRIICRGPYGREWWFPLAMGFTQQ